MQEITTKQAVGLMVNQPAAPPIIVPIKYCLYARKSTEQEEKQVLSIDSQIKEMLLIAQRDGLNIVEMRRESHSVPKIPAKGRCSMSWSRIFGRANLTPS